MTVPAELKCKFAQLKYEQLLSEKYFIETCFSKKFSSYSVKENFIDVLFEIKARYSEKVPITTTVTEIDCT